MLLSEYGRFLTAIFYSVYNKIYADTVDFFKYLLEPDEQSSSSFLFPFLPLRLKHDQTSDEVMFLMIRRIVSP